MPTPDQLGRDQARLRRYRILRNIAIVLGVILISIAWIIAGISSSIVDERFLQLVVSGLVAASFALLLVGALLHGLARRSHGEV
jgi:hypothetical protein